MNQMFSRTKLFAFQKEIIFSLHQQEMESTAFNSDGMSNVNQFKNVFIHILAMAISRAYRQNVF